MRFSRLIHVVSSFGIVLGAYWAYALCAVPLIEPTLDANRLNDASAFGEAQFTLPTQRFHESLAPYFPAGSWELEDAKILKTSQAILLMRDFRELKDGRLKIQPCTVVFQTASRVNLANNDSHAKGRALVMRAPDGAVLKFDRNLDFRSGNVGRLMGGWLPGPVTIHGTESQAGAGDALRITTQNVKIVAEKIWTPHAVEIRLGESLISGRDLTILMNPATSKTRGNTLSGTFASGVKSIELVHVHQIHLQLNAHRQRNRPAAWRGETEVAKQPSHLEISCRGAFKLDLVNNLASFEDQVTLMQLYPDGASDRLSCQRLEIQLSPRTPTPASHHANSPGKRVSRDSLSDWGIESITAVGHPVVFHSPQRYGTIRCELLEYNLTQRRLRLEGHERVTLHARQYEVLATRLQCEFSEANQIENLWASGPGWFRGALQASDSQRVEASWGKEFILRPHGSEQLLSLVGSPMEMAQIQASDQGRISAAEIHIWLRGTTPQPNAPSQQRETGLSASSKSRAIRPSRMRADGDVHFDSSQLSGATNHLEVWIQAPQRSQGDATAGDKKGGDTVTRIDRFGNDQGSPWTRAVTTQGLRAQKYHVLGEWMRVLFIQGQDGLQLDDVSVNGHAELSEIRSGPTGQLPLKMTGDMFHLRRASSADLAATVRGRPATVRSQGMGLSGGTIELDRAAQRVWIDGPGEVTLPMNQDLSGKPSSRPQVAKIAWRDGMDFNGRQVVVVGSVVASTRDQFLRASRLSATLNSAIDFQLLRARTESISVRYIEGSGDVWLESRTYDDQMRLASIETMNVHDFAADLMTGQLQAQGPGWIRSVHRGSPRSPIPGDTRNRSGDGQLNYLRVRFLQGIDGNLYRREVHFHQNVQTVYGPVPSWEDDLENNLTRLDDRTVLIDCDQLTILQMDSGPIEESSLDLRAVGNTVIEGNMFVAYAHQLKYSQQKDQLILEGDGRRDALLIRRTAAGESRTAAGSIMYSHSRRQLRVQDGGFFDSVQTQ